MAEVADEAYIERCFNCGKKITKPVVYPSYVFCSEECKNEFISSGKPSKKA